MRYTLMLFLTLAIKTAPAADKEVLPDLLLAEIRALRMDLQATVANIQRVQIAMYRLQAQGAVVAKATGRLEMARATCTQAQDQQKLTAAELERIKKQSSPNGVEQKAGEESIALMQSTMEMWVSRALQCQGEQADAEAQFRLEQAKMSELESQLERLDQDLAGRGRN